MSKTKTLSIKISLELEVVTDAKYDNDWVAGQFLCKGRCSVLAFSGEPAAVLTAASGVESVRQISDAS